MFYQLLEEDVTEIFVLLSVTIVGIYAFNMIDSEAGNEKRFATPFIETEKTGFMKVFLKFWKNVP